MPTKKRNTSKDHRRFLALAESAQFMGTVSRDEAEHSGLGRLALAMRPAIAVIPIAENSVVAQPCTLHTDNPGECPQAHMCGRCGSKLSDHNTTAAQCPTKKSGNFTPDAATLKRFPEQYPSTTRPTNSADECSTNTVVAEGAAVADGKLAENSAHIGFLKGGGGVVCKDCNDDPENTKLYRENIGQYSQSCHSCGKQMVAPQSAAWPELFSKNKNEDSSDATAQLKQDVAASANKPGQIIPPNAQADERNPAALGTQDGSKSVHNQEAGYAKGGQTLGMAIPADRRGSSATPSNRSMGTAPDGPGEVDSLGDPEIKRVFVESHATFADAVSSLLKFGLSLDEASQTLDAGLLSETLRKVMQRHIAEAKRSRDITASSAKRAKHWACINGVHCKGDDMCKAEKDTTPKNDNARPGKAFTEEANQWLNQSARDAKRVNEMKSINLPPNCTTCKKAINKPSQAIVTRSGVYHIGCQKK